MLRTRWRGRVAVLGASALAWAWLWSATATAQQGAPPGALPNATQPSGPPAAPIPPAQTAPAGQAAPRAAQVHGAPVTLEGREVFRILAPMGPLSPEARAELAAEHLRIVSDDPVYDETALKVVDTDVTTGILYRGMVVGLVTDEDAAAAGMTRAEAARQRLNAIREAVAAFRAEHSREALLHNGLFALLAIVILGLALGLSGYLHRWFGWKVERWCQPDGWLGGHAMLGAIGHQALARILLAALSILRWTLVLILVYVAIAMVFSFFPWTRELAEILASYGIEPLRVLWVGFLKHVPDLLFIAVVCVIAYVVIRALRWFFASIGAQEIKVAWVDPEWAGAYYRIARTTILAGVAVVIFPYIPGSETTAFKGVTIFLGALATFGSSTAISNLVNGFVLMTMRPYHTGDWIRAGDTEGKVEEVSLLVTRVRTAKNVVVVVPSSQMVGSHVLNYSEEARKDGLILHTTVTIGYDAPWRKVHHLLIEAALKTRGILAEPAPFVLQTSLDDSYVSYQINAYTRDACDQPRLYGELHQNIQECFNAGGVEILSPAFHALRDGNTVTIPAAHRPPGYEAPSFRVETRPGPPKDG